MSTVAMSKIRVVGLKSQRNLILSTLERSQCFEASPTADFGKGKKVKDTSHIERLAARRSRLDFAIGYINSVRNEVGSIKKTEEKKAKKHPEFKPRDFDYTPVPRQTGRRVMGYDDFYDVAAKEYELLTIVDEIEKINFQRTEIRSQINKLKIFNKNLLPYENVDIKFSLLGTKKTVEVMLADGGRKTELNLEKYGAIIESYQGIDGNVFGIIIPKGKKSEVTEELITKGYNICPYTFDDTAKNKIDDIKNQIKKLSEDNDEMIRKIITYGRYYDELKVLYDILSIEIEKSTIEFDFVKTNSTFVIEGWAPKEAAEIILSEIKSKTDKIVSYIFEPTEKDSPPTLMKNKQPISSFEDITNMYSVPAYGELDPNPVMAVFFFIFFGMMLGDAGYGLILSIGCFLALKFIKFEKGAKNMLVMFGVCGVSAIIWGIVFGGVFSIASVPPLWFNPLNEPITLLAVSIVLGAIHLMTGYILNMIKKINKGKALDGVLDNIFILIIFLGVAALVLNMLLKEKVQSSALSILSMVLLITAVAGILLTKGRKSKSIGGKIGGGLAGLYDLVSVFSDVISYARLFGLALSSGAIGMAFNEIAKMLFGIPGIGYVVGFIIAIPLHAFNMGLGLLSAYVHNIRLQYLEFYGKFYEGEGRAFLPLGQKTKYVRFS